MDISAARCRRCINHINDSAALNLNGGTFQIVAPSATVSQTETLGQINVLAASTITLDGTAITNAATNLQLTSNAYNGAFNFYGGTLNFNRIAPSGGGTTNLFLSPPPAARFDAPQATVNGQFAEYDVSGPNGLQARTSTGSFISQMPAGRTIGATR